MCYYIVFKDIKEYSEELDSSNGYSKIEDAYEVIKRLGYSSNRSKTNFTKIAFVVDESVYNKKDDESYYNYIVNGSTVFYD